MNIRFFASGRDPETSYLQLDKVGVKTDLESKKIVVDESEKSSVENIYSIGDAIFVSEINEVCCVGRVEIQIEI